MILNSFKTIKKIKYIFRIVSFSILFLTLNNCAGLFFDSTPLNVLETNHFTFFYYPDSIVEKNLTNIVRYSELSIKWFSAYTGVSVDIKPDIYLFDNGAGVQYNRISGIVDESIMDSNSTKGVITYYYKENDYIDASVTILHETIHVIQDYIFKLNNIGIAEGYASYLSFKYYYYVLDNNYSELSFFRLLNSYIYDDVLNNLEYPADIYKMTLPEFNGVTIGANGIERNPLVRYEISESFILYLIMNYGIEDVNEWSKETDRTNFKDRFKEVFGSDFDLEQDKWLIEVKTKDDY